MAMFITLGLISRPSAKMLSLAQHADYAQHLSVYAVSCTVHALDNKFLTYYLKRDTDIDVFYGLTKCCDFKRAFKTKQL